MILSSVTENEIFNETQKTEKKPKLTTNYFDVREEEAVKAYLIAETKQEKDSIYNEFLRGPLDKMIESIIRRYKLYRKDMTYIDIHADTHSFLMTKVDKFKPAKNKKAYSYFGTICKNYLMGQILKDQKEMNRKISYEDISATLENRPDIFLVDLKNYIEKNNLPDNETKMGYALIDLFDDYGNIFIGNDNNKFNKNIVLLTLREMTNLNTKEIRTCLKKYKTVYLDTLRRIHNQ